MTTMIRSNRQPLTMDQIRSAAPSAFAVQPYNRMSLKYAYIPTANVIEGMFAAGFNVFQASQSRTRIEDKKDFTKHMIRFRAQSTALAVGDVFPEVVLINSHDGSSAYKLYAGLFRLVCSNGAIVADSLLGAISVRHSGNVIEEVAKGSIEIVEQMPKTIDCVARWKGALLSETEQSIYAQAAHALRFADNEGKVDAPIAPQQLLTVRREQDAANDLWSTFNRVQENVIRGGLEGVSATQRRVRTREVKSIDKDVRLNRALWTLTEKMAELKGVSN